MTGKPTFFKTSAAFRSWLEKNHDKKPELLAGFYKKGSGKPSMTWPESVDQALCFGWIDGVRRRIDDDSYSIRFSPRRRGSIWSAVNTRRFEELNKLGLVRPAGLRAFDERNRTGAYSYENAPRELDPAYEQRFRSNKAAWAFFTAQPPYYRRVASFFVMSAKKEETRERRLAKLIGASAKQRRLM